MNRFAPRPNTALPAGVENGRERFLKASLMMTNKVNLNIDDILKQSPQWDFTVTVGGTERQTREASFDELNAMKTFSGKDKLEDLIAMLESLFVEPPKLEWNIALVSAFARGYLGYYLEYSKQKNEAMMNVVPLASSRVREQIAAAQQQS